ncbi:peptide ABC transporter ATP-binding protein [Alkalihalobacillus alcalophilus ATCC 27647 = CGMCC 1.3604]|uniref:Dipeptide/oligopeptide transporter n=1 Tax=Alkalihalobacillus alcalophilus ATCC 27647 = CGMCC 1.3604 TaxID=1218173 RepID=J8TU25_ALKAL|nr:ABC transporter ATP-binding protein [Alkalihalobacillus alcalophilus]AFV25680.1 dipeptide/oligopeptide transporter [Alkalihalobacillus alcalophilus ATCC 27647 = CGMCC 1.3604]KGA96525.1 peptide ABC transporter ATPase [Alkalihalobacillus alcalophilus ATCC 27647 = CGMCC 1.3604]MED1561683.1 ABC transporter ATP-binding protein [Alkalihalobacillus alcalophilus]THG90921.1 peptide ABC transporter ATP-binding protein [Alkalihalobacillus alcalophilus ATCC 27647 = CGMCC 1.3604]
MTNQLLKIQNLQTSFRIKDDYHAAVDGVTLEVNKNEIVAIVGESGCGKSALAFSIMGFHDPKRSKIEGHIYYKEHDLANISTAKLNKLRGSEMGMIFQDPLTALNPLMVVGAQIEETLILHTKMNKEQRKARVLELLDSVGIPNPQRTFNQYPHELSGGMRQRVVIAIAIANKPAFLVADEPTTALDVTIQAQILDLMKELKEKMDAGVILITHDLGVVAEMADRVAVMYAGQIVELAPVEELFANPKHPYTRSLLQSVPSTDKKDERLHVIQGIVPPLPSLPRVGCRFKARIPWIPEEAHEENPELHEIKPGHFVRCTCYKTFHFQDEQKGDMNNGVS